MATLPMQSGSTHPDTTPTPLDAPSSTRRTDSAPPSRAITSDGRALVAGGDRLGDESMPAGSRSEPITAEYIESVRLKMCHLLMMDAQFGGNEASAQALRLFHSTHRRVGASRWPRSLRRDLYSTAGELAEIAGWLLCDAGRQREARRLNHEALHYLRLAGDRSLEILTLQNMSMQAEYLDRPVEALSIAESVLENDRPPAG